MVVATVRTGLEEIGMTNYEKVVESIRQKAKDAAWAGKPCPHYKREDYARSARRAYEHVTYMQATEAQRLAQR